MRFRCRVNGCPHRIALRTEVCRRQPRSERVLDARSQMTEACTSMQHGARPGATPAGSCHGSMAAAAAAESTLARGPSSHALEGPSIAPESTAGQAGQPPVCQASTSTERDAWAADMRRRFSPPAMLDAAGNIVQVSSLGHCGGGIDKGFGMRPFSGIPGTQEGSSAMPCR